MRDGRIRFRKTSTGSKSFPHSAWLCAFLWASIAGQEKGNSERSFKLVTVPFFRGQRQKGERSLSHKCVSFRFPRQNDVGKRLMRRRYPSFYSDPRRFSKRSKNRETSMPSTSAWCTSTDTGIRQQPSCWEYRPNTIRGIESLLPFVGFDMAVNRTQGNVE